MVREESEQLKIAMEDEARNILGFWERYAVDPHGGFYGVLDSNLKPHADAKKHLVLNTRLIWTFSAAYRVLKKQSYKEMAQRAYNYFISHFTDSQYGGVYWELNADGTVYDATKRTYGEAFAIYALSEYYNTFRDKKALEQAISIYRCLEEHAFDEENKGYYEALLQDWRFEQGKQISNINPYESASKTMNTHLHLLEAYTSLYKVWKNVDLKDRLREHIKIMTDKIVDHNTWHFRLYFDRTWKSLSSAVSYGHDIEGSWLLWEAAEMIDGDKIKEYVKPVSIKMAHAVLKEGWHRDGGILYEAEPNKPINFNRSWWVQVEAVVGFFNAWELTGEDEYYRAALRVWKFIDEEIVDHINGGWFSFAVSDRISVNRIDGWTCPYHNTRMCLELMEKHRDASCRGKE
jgi:mannobiose 2-epimerase